MKRILGIVCLCLMAISCEKGIDRNSKEYDVRQIYKALIERSATYNKMRIKVSDELISRPIAEDSMYLIKKGLRRFNDEIQKSIDAYNRPEDDSIFSSALKSLGAKKYEDAQYQLSKIGFNNSREYAVVYEADGNTPEISHRSFLFFKKVNGEWRMDTEIIE
jgi:hypothetical protein